MSGNEQIATFETDHPKDQTWDLVGQYPGQVKLSSPPRRRSVRPHRNNVEEISLPGLMPSGEENRQ